MQEKRNLLPALRAAFPHTVPILAGFLFLGVTYGILMTSSGFSPLLSILISTCVFAGSMQFVAVNLLLGAFAPLSAFLMTLMINARHIFYGISMLDKYKNVGKKRTYLIFGMCDESFSINCTATPPDGVDRGLFMFFVTLLNQLYWIIGTALGAVFGAFLPINTEGIDFAMTAMFAVIFLEQCLKRENRLAAAAGLAASLLCLLLFGPDRFLLPAMAAILILLAVLRRPLEEAKK